MDGAVSIGRNIGSEPMSDSDWQDFGWSVRHAIQQRGGTVYATAYGRGEWEGVAEDNAVITFGDVQDIAGLREHLQLLAKTFEQDAIALVTGTSELVSA